ncbi:tannase and feruloyl esterase [Penicillium sp. IBT 31633x]|nr:tannase and feruloyl esterase [Penicillium sp. IBT 31633x]
MKYFTVFQLCALALSVSAVSHETKRFEERCTSLASLNIQGSEFISSYFVKSGTNLTFPQNDPSCSRPSQLVSQDLCRVALNVTTSPRSGIFMEVWLPEQWSGRFLSTGNGGLGGCIQYEDMDYTASLGFATVGTNNGHNGMAGDSFFNNPDTIEDFAYRAVRVGVIVGKQISRAFYGKLHTKSYYLGCSTGGRQGFKEAQTFPEDFDGIVAGAPAFSFNNLTSWSCHFYPLTGPEGSSTFVPLSMWSIIHADILNQCDGLDGVRDGIIESPDLCNYTVSSDLICRHGQGNKTNCLTPKQVETVNNIFSPLLGVDGSLVYPRMQPGSEELGAAQIYYSGKPFDAADWFRYAILNNASWDPLTLSAEDYALASHKNPFNIETWDGDLSAFKNRGSKILHYHGLVDQIISSDNSARYYEHVSQTMGLAPRDMDEFYRYFRISGMAHCGGGPGASFIGNSKRNAASLHAEENVLAAMVRWVEDGIPPDTITGTAYVNGTSDGEPAFKRRHCRWPYRNVYQNSGDPKNAANWKCI